MRVLKSFTSLSGISYKEGDTISKYEYEGLTIDEQDLYISKEEFEGLDPEYYDTDES